MLVVMSPGQVMTTATVWVTVTPAEAGLRHLPDAVAAAVTTWPGLNGLSPLFVQVPPLTVVVPTELPLTSTSIVVPLASLLVPRTLLAPAQIGEFTTGEAE